MSGLNAHVRAVHREEGCGFECDECGKEFGYRSVRDRHVEKMHRQGGDGRKRGRSEKDKAFGRVDKRRRTSETGGEDEEPVRLNETEDVDDESELPDGGERESGRDVALESCSHSTAICVM